MDKGKLVKKTLEMALREFAGIIPVGAAFNAVWEAVDEVKSEEDMNRVKKGLSQIEEVIRQYDDKLSYYLEEYSDEISYKFSRGLEDSEIDAFVKELGDNDIPLESGDFWEERDGISLHLGEGKGLTEYEISKAGKRLDEILKRIDPDLSVEKAGRTDSNNKDVEVRL